MIAELRLEYSAIDHQQILIEGRAAHAVHGQRGSANQCLGDFVYGQEHDNSFEQSHGGSMAFDGDGTRPTARPRFSATRESSALQQCAVICSATSWSPSRSASAMRSEAVRRPTASADSRRRLSAIDRMNPVYGRHRLPSCGWKSRHLRLNRRACIWDEWSQDADARASASRLRERARFSRCGRPSPDRRGWPSAPAPARRCRR